MFLFSTLCHLTAFILFILNSWTIPVKELFFSHFVILLIISFLLTIGIYLYRKTAPLLSFILLKFFILFLIGYPLGSYIWLELLLFTSLILETGLFLSFPTNLYTIFLMNLLFLFSQREISAWWYKLNDVSLHDMLFTVFYCSFVSVITFILAYNISEREKKDKKIERLDAAISQLTDANIGFQKYVKVIELDSIINERKRLSREIHDAVGYSLTNIIMLLEAAALLAGKDLGKQKESIFNAKKQAVNGLEETRLALRHLREEKIESLYGIRAVDELIKAFRNATGIDIQVEYGNFPTFTNEVVDAMIFRMIQEGMTNAFRHGMATKITILFWHDKGLIRLFIHDNGSGTSDIIEGIGIAGMRERLVKIGGRLTLKNVIDGFELGAEIPWRKEVEK